jgi:hypothetical protein
VTTYPISQTEWDVLKATSPDTQVLLKLVADSAKDLTPRKKIIVRPLYDKQCGSVTVRKVLSTRKYLSGIAAAIVVSGFMLRDDLSAYVREGAPEKESEVQG